MLTRRQFLKAIASFPFWHRWLDAVVTDDDDLWGHPWGFGDGGLAFPVYFITGQQRLNMTHPRKFYLPLIDKG